MVVVLLIFPQVQSSFNSPIFYINWLINISDSQYAQLEEEFYYWKLKVKTQLSETRFDPLWSNHYFQHNKNEILINLNEFAALSGIEHWIFFGCVQFSKNVTIKDY